MALLSLLSAVGCSGRDPFDPAKLYEKISPGVVTVVTVTSGEREARRVVTASMGTGILVDPSGLVVTAAHVVSKGDRIGVVYSDGTRARADVVQADEVSDLAMLQARTPPPASAVVLELADSSDLAVGERVLVIGNPEGMPGTMTHGIVSGLHRRGTTNRAYNDLIQTDAPLFHGCSGGPLVDSAGRVVGVVVGTGQGKAGFAIPAHRARVILERLARGAPVVRAWLGIRVGDLEPVEREALGLDPGVGVVVLRVTPGSPASAAGLLPGDVLVELDGDPVTGPADMAWRVWPRRPGDDLELELLRRGASTTVQVTLQLRPKGDSDAL